MTFTAPLFLLLLLAAPLVGWLGWPNRGPARRREVLSLVVRLVILLAVVFSLAGLETVHAADNVAVVFLVDVSDSMPPEARALAFQWVRDSLKTMSPDDKAAVILFGGNALVERPMSSRAELEPFTSIPVTLETDLAEAIRLAQALFPAGAGRRIVILSDGVATTGDAEGAARLAAANGVQIVAVPFQFSRANEVLLDEVHAPSVLRQGEQFGLEVTMLSTRQTAAEVRVFVNGVLAHTGNVELKAGRNSVVIPLTAGAPGFATYRVQIAPVADTFYQNNELAAFSTVLGPPKVLLIALPPDAERPDEYSPLLAALRAANITVEVHPPAELPSTLSDLAEYASVVLVDVPATALSPRQMQAIQSYVRDLGGGLVAVGGPTSYGVGGYFQTPLEEALPVEMQIKDQKRFPEVSFVVVMDKSGSMGQPEGGVTKMRLADEGAARVAELMHDFDEITVIAFDTTPVDVIGPLPGTERDQAAGRARQIGPGGGGIYIRDALTFAASISRQSTKKTRHIILLADGSDSEQQEGARDIVRGLVADGITLSVVSIGDGQDVPFLQDIARLGSGRFHLTNSAASIPDILTSEAMEVQRNYIIEETFYPDQINPSPIMDGMTAVPPLYGYVGTSARETANTILVSELADGNRDPILASWQYGLGRAVAWTSDASGRWAQAWVNWDGFPRLWEQIVKYTINTSLNVDITAEVSRAGEQAILRVDALDRDGRYLNNLPVQASLVMPDGSRAVLDMAQVAPGRYQAAFTPTTEGAYLIRVNGGDASTGLSIGQTTGWVLSYSPEYRVLKADASALVRLALVTGGDALAEPSWAFRHDLKTQRAAHPLWPWLMIVAAALLPFDIAIRRLTISRFEVQRALLRIREFGLSLRRPEAERVRTEAADRLMRAKRRAATTPARPPAGPQNASPLDSPNPRPDAKPAEGPKPEGPAQIAQPPTSAVPPNTAGALLAKKRARRGDGKGR